MAQEDWEARIKGMQSIKKQFEAVGLEKYAYAPANAAWEFLNAYTLSEELKETPNFQRFLDMDAPEALEVAGVYFYEKGEEEKARSLLEKSVRLGPRFQAVYYLQQLEGDTAIDKGLEMYMLIQESFELYLAGRHFEGMDMLDEAWQLYDKALGKSFSMGVFFADGGFGSGGGF